MEYGTSCNDSRRHVETTGLRRATRCTYIYLEMFDLSVFVASVICDTQSKYSQPSHSLARTNQWIYWRTCVVRRSWRSYRDILEFRKVLASCLSTGLSLEPTKTCIIAYRHIDFLRRHSGASSTLLNCFLELLFTSSHPFPTAATPSCNHEAETAYYLTAA
jgi:hypothetical protein